MKKYFNDKRKLAIFSVFLLVTLAACSSPRLADGSIDPKQIIDLSTSWGSVFSSGWFDGIFVYPVAQLINIFGNITGDAGLAIILAVLAINILIGGVTLKSQMSQQKMQMCKPELDRINAKYKNKKDDRSRQLQAKELQDLYAKYDINPFGSIIPMLIQLPVMFSVYYAVMRAKTVIGGTFVGIELDTTPLNGVSDGQFVYLIIFGLMILAQFLSMKMPQWLTERRKKLEKVKTKKYAQAKPSGGMMESSMNAMMYVSLGMISLLCLNWPLSMSFYWLVNAATRVGQNVIIDHIIGKKNQDEKKLV